MKKRIILIAIIGLFLLMLPLMANAEIDSGTWGDLTWSISDEGILEISGSGPMNNFNWYGEYSKAWTPWLSDKITEIHIGNGVTSIGYNAFNQCINLTSITIPESITRINDRAFRNCYNLETITFLGDVSFIGQEAFMNCSKLAQITLPSGLSTISKGLFTTCDSITSLIIPDGVTSIEDDIISSYIIENSRFEYITIPDSVTSIHRYALRFAPNLKQIICSDNSYAAQWADNNGFAHSDHIHMLSVYAENEMEIYWECSVCNKKYSDTSCTNEVIDGGTCGNGVIWTLDDEGLLTISGNGKIVRTPWSNHSKDIKNVILNEGVTNVPSFAYYENLVQIEIPDTVTEISHFTGCSSLINISIPDDVTSFPWQVFQDCVSLQSVKLPANLDGISFRAFDNCTSLSSITIPAGVTFISGCAFANCSALSSINIPDTVGNIGYSAFLHCSNLSSIILPESINFIGYCAFSRCSSLISINIPEKANLDHSVFTDCQSLTSVVLPKGVNNLNGTFANCSALETVIIQGRITNDLDGDIDPFADCTKLKEIYIPICNTSAIQWIQEHYWDVSLTITPHINVSITEAKEPTESETGLTEGSRCSACGETIVESKTIPALCNMTVLRLPSSLISIEESSFENLTCQAIIIPDGCATIKEKAFANNNNLLYVHIPASVTSIADDAFEGCDNVAIFREED